LHPVVVERFRAWLAGRELDPDEPLFRLRTAGGHWRKTSKMMKLDLERAGIPYRDEDGLFADFHANRHTYITNLGKTGASLTTAQSLARHSDPKLTASTYTHLGLSDKAAAIEALPPPPGGIANPDKHAAPDATGTDNPRTPANGLLIQSPGAKWAQNGAQLDGENGGMVAGHGEKAKGNCPEISKSNSLIAKTLDKERRDVASAGGSAPWRTRTSNPLIKSQMLCQLS
jgi:hypothetical protein